MQRRFRPRSGLVTVGQPSCEVVRGRASALVVGCSPVKCRRRWVALSPVTTVGGRSTVSGAALISAALEKRQGTSITRLVPRLKPLQLGSPWPILLPNKPSIRRGAGALHFSA